MSFLDLTNVEVKKNDFEPLPSGMYLLQCDAAEIKDTKSGGGQYIKLKFKVVGPGEGHGRVLWQNINFKHSNPKVVEIGVQELKNFMLAANCKTFKLESPRDLEGLSAMAKVVVEESEKFGKQNAITYWTAYDEKKHSSMVQKKTDINLGALPF